MLGYLSRKVRFIPRPVSKSASEAMHRHMLRIPAQHPAQHHFQRHPRKRPSGPLAREYELGDSRLSELLEDRERWLAQRDSVFTASFHSPGGNGPNLGGKVDLGPLRAKDFARTRCRQNGKLQRQGSDSVSFSKLVDKGRNVGVAYRRVMTARELG